MDKILTIARREYTQSVKTKTFWIGMLAFPLLMAAMFVVPLGLMQISPDEQKTIAVVDETGRLVEPFSARLAEHRLKDDRPEYVVEQVPVAGSVEATRRELEPRVLGGELYALITIADDLGPDAFGLFRKSVGDEGTARAIRSALYDEVVVLRLERSELDLDSERLKTLTARVQLQNYQVTPDGEAKKKDFDEAFLATYLFVAMLYFMIYFYGFSVTRGVLQEKTSRVMEVLLGSVTPNQLMTGKILGLGLVGLTQAGVYMIFVGVLRVVAVSLFTGMDLSAVLDLLAPTTLIFFVVYFLLGYFLFTTVFAMIGAACNSEQEAQYLQMPVMACLLIPLISTIFFVQHPDSTAATIFSLIPIFTPMLMFMRISVLTPPAWQIILSLVLTIGAIYFMFKAAARVFRIGTLMYGKRPTIGEIVRWARRSA